MKKILFSVVSIGVFSSLFFEAPSTNFCLAQTQNRCQEKEEKKSEKADQNYLVKISKYVASFVSNILIANKLQNVTDQIGFTDSKKFSSRVGEVASVIKAFPNTKKTFIAVAKNSQTIEKAANIPFFVSLFITLLSPFGKMLNFAIGLPDLSYLTACVLGSKIALTQENSLTKSILDQAINYFDDKYKDDPKVSEGNDSASLKKRRF